VSENNQFSKSSERLTRCAFRSALGALLYALRRFKVQAHGKEEEISDKPCLSRTFINANNAMNSTNAINQTNQINHRNQTNQKLIILDNVPFDRTPSTFEGGGTLSQQSQPLTLKS